MDDTTRADLAEYTGCIAGALTEDEFRQAVGDLRSAPRIYAAARR